MRTVAVVVLPFLLVNVLLVNIASASDSDVAALIKKQSQEFSDASASGDAAVIAKYLDDRVIFMNETGGIGTKKEIVDSAQPPPKGVSHTLEQSDFKIEIHGNVAVTSFVDNSTQKASGQTFTAKYLSTEIWMKEDSGWKMISSQTMTAPPDDPPTIALPSKTLDEYVGTYESGPDLKFRITRNGDELSGTLNDGKPFAIKTELRDVLVTPGQPRLRRVVQRDENGKITGLVSFRDGHDLVLKRVG